MKKLLPLFYVWFFASLTSLPAETLFGPGTISIATNEAILINTIAGKRDGANYVLYLNGLSIAFIDTSLGQNPRYAIAGDKDLTVSNQTIVTFQRLQGSSVRTVLVTNGATNIISVPTGKTIQFFARNPVQTFYAHAQPLNSTNSYQFFDELEYVHPQVTGPATVTLSAIPSVGDAVLVSYYFTDELLQLPPSGLISTPAQTLEVNVEKSYNLTNWTPAAAFHTEAEAGAFYRLRIVK